MTITLPENARGPILDLTLPKSEPKQDIILRNVTTGEQLAVNLPPEWNGDDLSLDFYRRTVKDQTGADRSALLDPGDNELWSPEPLIAGVNDVEIEVVPGLSLVNSTFVKTPAGPMGVSADGTYIYWADASAGTIGRAKLDGSEANNALINPLNAPADVVVNATHIYWADPSESAIGRAKIDGSGVTAAFIAAPAQPFGIAIDGTYIYWADASEGTIGRAKLDGSEANAKFIDPAGSPRDVVVDANYVYWSENAANLLGRAYLDGSTPKSNLLSSLSEPMGMAVSGGFLYWAEEEGGTIGRAKLNFKISSTVTVALRWEKGYY